MKRELTRLALGAAEEESLRRRIERMEEEVEIVLPLVEPDVEPLPWLDFKED